MLASIRSTEPVARARAARRTGLALLTLFGVALPPVSAPAQSGAPERAGVVAAVSGDVRIVRAGAERPATSGDAVHRGDSVRSGADGSLQILLLDETTFTVGPSSTISIDDFVFDPASEGGRVETRLVQGAFRFVTGRIARKRPEQMNVRLPAGNIGIRGTIVGVRIDPATGGALAVLLGPGRENDTGDPPGGFALENAGGTTDVGRPGWGARIETPEATPGEPFELPPAELSALVQAFAPPPAAPAGEPLAQAEPGVTPAPEGTPANGEGAPAPGGGTSPTAPQPGDAPPPLPPGEVAGAPAAVGANLATQTLQLDGQLASFQQVLAQQAQDPSSQVVKHLTSFAELDQLSRVFTGEYIYRAFDVPFVAGSGFAGGIFDLVMRIHFGPKQIDWQLLNVRWAAAGLTGFGSAFASVGALPGTTNPGPAVFSGVSAMYFQSLSPCSTGCPTVFDTSLSSVGTQPAAAADVKVSLDPPGPLLGQGEVRDLPIDQVIP